LALIVVWRFVPRWTRRQGWAGDGGAVAVAALGGLVPVSTRGCLLDIVIVSSIRRAWTKSLSSLRGQSR
jgi:hypothetical protein